MDRSAERRSQFAEAFKRDCSDDLIAIFEMRIENWLAVFYLLGETPDRDGSPAVAFCDRPCSYDDPAFTVDPLSSLAFADTHPSAPIFMRAIFPGAKLSKGTLIDKLALLD